ncbi:MAG: helix-turn-helix domain-containing protein [Myxococcota bacterium]
MPLFLRQHVDKLDRRWLRQQGIGVREQSVRNLAVDMLLAIASVCESIKDEEGVLVVTQREPHRSEVFGSGLSTLLDTFSTANTLASARKRGARFKTELVGMRRRVRTAQGFDLSHKLSRGGASAEPDLVIVPAMKSKDPQSLDAMLNRRECLDAKAWLAEHLATRTELAAVCTGTYLLAASGALTGRVATTSWWLGADFARRFPEVVVDAGQMIVRDGRCITAGAAMAHVDLALWFVRQRSPDLATRTARHLLYDEERPSQAAYAIPGHIAHDDPLVDRFERWVRRHLAEFSITAAARSLGVTERTLQRRIRSALDRTPLQFVQDLRIERALHRLRVGDDDLDEIASDVGYGSAAALRTVLRRRTGRSLRAHRVRGR